MNRRQLLKKALDLNLPHATRQTTEQLQQNLNLYSDISQKTTEDKK